MSEDIIKVEKYSDYRIRVFRETDPQDGTRIGIGLVAFSASAVERYLSLDSIPGIEYAILYRRCGPEIDTVLTFGSLRCFKRAQERSVFDSFECKALRDLFITINSGYADLLCTFANNRENIAVLESLGLNPAQAIEQGRAYSGPKPAGEQA